MNGRAVTSALPDEEVWKPIRWGCRQYQVSNHGRVRRSLSSFLRPGQPLKTTMKSGAIRVTLSNGSSKRSFVVHTLVARFFIGYRPTGSVIEFKDGDRANLHSTNLQYVTRKIAHARSSRLGFISRSAGRFQKARHALTSLMTPTKVREMRRLFDARLATYSELALWFNTSQLAVENIVHRKTWVTRGGKPIDDGAVALRAPQGATLPSMNAAKTQAEQCEV